MSKTMYDRTERKVCLMVCADELASEIMEMLGQGFVLRSIKQSTDEGEMFNPTETMFECTFHKGVTT